MAVRSLNQLSSRAIIGRYYATLEETQMASWVNDISMEFTSDQESEDYKWLGMTPAMREWTGGREPKGLRANGVTIKNKHYESTLEVPVEDIRRDKTAQIMLRVDDLAAKSVTHWNNLLSALIIAGTSGTCYDGHVFFDSDHSEGSSGTQSNLLTSSEVAALNVATATAPTADEMASAILGVIAFMHSYLDDQGEPMNENANEFTVMCGTPAIFSAAVQACSKLNLNTGTGVRDNPLIGTFKVKAQYNVRMAANTTQFVVVRTDSKAKPFIRQVEFDSGLKSVAEGSELEFRNGMWWFGVDAWRNVGYGYWQYAAHATMS